jgi:hypothetical protein
VSVFLTAIPMYSRESPKSSGDITISDDGDCREHPENTNNENAIEIATRPTGKSHPRDNTTDSVLFSIEVSPSSTKVGYYSSWKALI